VSGGGPLDFDARDAPPPARPPAPPEPPPPARPPGASRYTWFLGVVAFLLIVVVAINAIGTEGVETGGPQPDDRLIPFAVPLADAPPREDEDANVDAERVCAVRGRGVLNLCALARRGPVALALFPTEAERCRTVVGQFARVAPRAAGVQLVAVGSRGERALLRGAGRGDVLVGWDRDGAVASLYGLVGCPQLTFAARGGRVVESVHEPLSDAELLARLERLGR
jgi:hypothetical protein